MRICESKGFAFLSGTLIFTLRRQGLHLCHTCTCELRGHNNNLVMVAKDQYWGNFPVRASNGTHQRRSSAVSPSSLYHLQPPSRNFSLPVVSTACVLFRQMRLNGGRRKSLDPLRARSEERERERVGEWRSVCTAREREKERENERELLESGLGKSEQERCELRGHLVVKMKAPPLIAAPFVRGRRNRPIDSRIYRGGGMIQPGRSTTTLATADDSWCSWPESLHRIRRSSFRGSIASRYRRGASRAWGFRAIRPVFRLLFESEASTCSRFLTCTVWLNNYILSLYIIKYDHLWFSFREKKCY